MEQLYVVAGVKPTSMELPACGIILHGDAPSNPKHFNTFSPITCIWHLKFTMVQVLMVEAISGKFFSLMESK